MEANQNEIKKNTASATRTIRVSVGMFVHHESLCGSVNGTDWFLSSFFEDPHTSVSVKTLQASIISTQITRGTEGNNMLWAPTWNLKAAAWTCLEKYPSNVRLDAKRVITSYCDYSGGVGFFIENKGRRLNRPSTPLTSVETRPVQVIPHKSSSIIITIQFYIQISVSNKIPTCIQRLIMHPFSAGEFSFLLARCSTWSFTQFF